MTRPRLHHPAHPIEAAIFDRLGKVILLAARDISIEQGLDAAVGYEDLAQDVVMQAVVFYRRLAEEAKARGEGQDLLALRQQVFGYAKKALAKCVAWHCRKAKLRRGILAAHPDTLVPVVTDQADQILAQRERLQAVATLSQASGKHQRLFSATLTTGGGTPEQIAEAAGLRPRDVYDWRYKMRAAKFQTAANEVDTPSSAGEPPVSA